MVGLNEVESPGIYNIAQSPHTERVVMIMDVQAPFCPDKIPDIIEYESKNMNPIAELLDFNNWEMPIK